MAECLKKILDSLSKVGFFKTDKNVGHFTFGPLAALLANNIQSEWSRINGTSAEFNTFLYNSHSYGNWQEDCQTSFSLALQTFNEQLPFGLTSVLTNLVHLTKENGTGDDLQYPSYTTAYRRLIFINEKESQHYFYRLQRSRKIWWRKFSTDPERFNVTECKHNGIEETIQIAATFPWGSETVETIHNHGSAPLTANSSLFEVKVGRKKMVPHVLESVCLEAPAVMTYLCDAFQTLPSRTLMRLHYSLAPYKAALAIRLTDVDDTVEDLHQLAMHLCMKLRMAGLPILFSPGAGRARRALETLLTTHDMIGIPYTIVVAAETLTNGIVGLRSRDTTLQEQVHVSKLTPYMQQLLNQSS